MCLLHLIALATVMNQSVWIFDQTSGCGLSAPAGRFLSTSNEIFVMDYPEPFFSFVLAHEFCHQKEYQDNTYSNIAFVNEASCTLAGFNGLISSYDVTERSKVMNGGFWE